MPKLKYTKNQFDVFCIIFATYLFIHFAQLLPHATEMFSSSGLIKDPSYLPTYGMVPDILFYYDSPTFVLSFIVMLMVSSVALGIGYYRRAFSAFVFYGWVCLLNRNPFISNPSMAYIGWMLLATTLTPRKQAEKKWMLSSELYWGAWIIMGVSYTASGFHKFFNSPSWSDGTALHHVLTGALSRNNIGVQMLLMMPDFVLNFMTWLSLFAEISFLFIGCAYHMRRFYWAFFMAFHIGILALINFADLTFGMLMIHIFTFDQRWIPEFQNDLKRIRSVINMFKSIKSKTSALKNKISKISETDSSSTGSTDSTDSTNSTNSMNSTNSTNSMNSTNSTNSMNSTDSTDNSEKSSGTYDDSMDFRYWVLQASVLLGFLSWVLFHYQERSFLEIFDRMTQISMNMTWGLGIIGGSLVTLMVLEQIYPHFKLEPVKGWWKWLIVIYLFQGLSVIIATFTWEHWLQETSFFKGVNGFHLRDHVNPFLGGFLTYLFNTWVFYWWHLARHRVYFLWILTHQMHHSPTRLETITSFYKHPLEIVLDSQIIAIISYSMLGMSPESSIWVSIFSAFGEYVYHMNLRTPRWVGYIFQRPESHRLHHRKNSRLNCPNYADLPLWDIINNTFDNPDPDHYEETGFPSREEWRWWMIMFVDVLKPGQNKWDNTHLKLIFKKTLMYSLIIWGAASSVGYMIHENRVRGIGFASVSSPLPLVFSSYQGVETFSTTFSLNAEFQNSTTIQMEMDSSLYAKIQGSYNRQNIYGAMFSHGVFFVDPKMLHLRNEILHYAVCDPGVLMQDFGIDGKIKKFDVTIRSKTLGDERTWNLALEC